jgi:hypothetical protein
MADVVSQMSVDNGHLRVSLENVLNALDVFQVFGPGGRSETRIEEDGNPQPDDLFS